MTDEKPRSLKWSPSPRAIVQAALLSAVALFFTFGMDTAGVVAGQQWLTTQAATLVDETLAKNQTVFLIVSSIKAGMALIEGSSVGVGFHLEVGDLIQPAYDYVDFFWNIFLYAFLIMGAYKLLLETGLLTMGLPLMGVGFLFLAAALLIKKQKRPLFFMGRQCVLFGLLIAYVAPTAILSTHYLSKKYCQPLKDRQEEQILQFNQSFERTKAEAIKLRSKISVLQPEESLQEIKRDLMELADAMGDAFASSFQAFLYYVILVLFDVLVFPLISAFILFRFVKFGLQRVLEPPLKQDQPAD
ncbi:MAG: hypothetical protein KJ052_11020 [Candidatus Hydrogenedentes bacterium]|nr:hypothetical protein [Candidatus Hydrogenedentota bacterium]